MNQIVQNQKTAAQLVRSRFAAIKAALPEHLSPDRMLQVVFNEFRNTPKLASCNPESLVGAVIKASALGLEPGSALGHCWLIPYGNNVQFIIGYRGMIDLARRSGQIASISAQVVYENDTFEFEYGLDEKLRHVPAKGVRGDVTHAYAVAKLKGGGYQFEVMTKEDLEQVRKNSKNASGDTWVKHTEEMYKKTVLRRLFKYLPVSIEAQKAVTIDEAADRGEQNKFFDEMANDSLTFDSETSELIESEEKPVSQSEALAKKLQGVPA